MISRDVTFCSLHLECSFKAAAPGVQTGFSCFLQLCITRHDRLIFQHFFVVVAEIKGVCQYPSYMSALLRQALLCVTTVQKQSLEIPPWQARLYLVYFPPVPSLSSIPQDSHLHSRSSQDHAPHLSMSPLCFYFCNIFSTCLKTPALWGGEANYSILLSGLALGDIRTPWLTLSTVAGCSFRRRTDPMCSSAMLILISWRRLCPVPECQLQCFSFQLTPYCLHPNHFQSFQLRLSQIRVIYKSARIYLLVFSLLLSAGILSLFCSFSPIRHSTLCW